jgi:hypothetical protein
MALAFFGAVIPRCNAQGACDTVSIDSAGDYRIKHSRIKGLPTMHNRGGIALWVVLWPGDDPTDEDLVELSLQGRFETRPSA